MEKVFVKVIPTRFDIEEEDYDYLLAVSSDSLVVIDKQLNQLQQILLGNDMETVVCGCEDENNFLDSISIFKKCIEEGNNPIRHFGLK